MKKTEMIKRHESFDDIIKNGKQVKTKYFVLCSKENDVNKTLFGVAVSKKVGNAVIRNALKRRYRNIIDNNKLLFKNKTNYIIIIRKESLNADFSKLDETLQLTLKKENNEKTN